MKSFLIILAGLFLSWYFTDLSSDSSFQNILAPIFLFVFLIALAIWLILKAGFGKRIDDNDFGGGGGGFDGGCDGY